MAATTFSLQSIVRPNILALKPYRCARDDFSSGVLLDANENAYGPALNPTSDAAVASAGLDINRYPDPHQTDLKNLLAKFRNIPGPEHFFLGVGSDEVIDMIFRVFCVPGKDAVLITPPTYGMYSVSAQINDVEVKKATLTLDGNFQLNVDEVRELFCDRKRKDCIPLKCRWLTTFLVLRFIFYVLLCSDREAGQCPPKYQSHLFVQSRKPYWISSLARQHSSCAHVAQLQGYCCRG